MHSPVKPPPQAPLSSRAAPPPAAWHGGDPDSRLPVLALLLATLCWGAGFTWAKVAGETVNQLITSKRSAAIGPVLVLGVRFVLAGVIWMLIFPRARRGWSRRSIARAAILGGLLAAGLIPQHIGLDQTSEAVSAFLTSLTIVFVPVISTLALRRAPRPTAWIAVALATAGVWLMTGAAPGRHFGVGESLGLAGAVLFSLHVLTVNAIVPRDDPFRMTGGQFIVVGAVALLVGALLPGGAGALRPASLAHVFALREVWLNTALLVIFPTLISFGLLTGFQPRMDATRAALVYLMEPIFASLYAYVFASRRLHMVELTGAAIILTANLMVELIESRMRSQPRRDFAARELV